MTLTITLSEALSIKLWPHFNRAAVISPFGTTSLSIDELLRAVKKARAERKWEKKA